MITFPFLGQAGRLGNQLWQIASTVGIALDRGEDWSFPTWEYQPHFSVPPEWFSGEPGINSHELVPHIDERAAVYLQDLNLWANYHELIKGIFQPSNTALKQLFQFEDFFNLEPPVLSLHVRRTDYATNPPGTLTSVPMRYYFNALKAMEGKYQSLVVFSDDIDWCRTQFADQATYFFPGVARPFEHEVNYRTAPILDWIDMQLMTFCDYHIISNSTYSWWGAFLSDDEEPIYPAFWFGKKLDYINTQLMFPPNWRKMECR